MDNIAGVSGGDRQPYVAGTFYPATEKELSSMLGELYRSAGSIRSGTNTRALIVPHAGYTYSGEVAAAAYASLPEKNQYENIFLIGSSHRVSFQGASVYSRGDYLTPLGRVSVNGTIVRRLIDESELFSYYPPAHSGEHSLEVQLPFIQYRFGRDIRIVPVILGTTNKATCEAIASVLKPWFNSKNLFVISSDFSHYPGYDDAVQTDRLTADALMSGNSSLFLKVIKSNMAREIAGLSTCMCGWTAALVLLEMASGTKNLEFRHITYRNSGDSIAGDRGRVVGYHAISLIETVMNDQDGENKGASVDFALTDDESRILLKIARESIGSRFSDSHSAAEEPEGLTPVMKQPLGAFVTITINGSLRGCIGRFMSSEPLWKVVSEMARSAAFSDTRFNPITRDELRKIIIEISVLSPLSKVEDTSEIVPGRHGVYIRKDYKSGTFLPQVAKGKNWSVEELLGYISRDKAGLGWSGWKDAEIFTYEAVIIEEEK